MRKAREVRGVPVEFICWTTQYNNDRIVYASAPMIRNGRRLSFEEAHPEHWWSEPLTDRICDEWVSRPNDMCRNCNQVQFDWQKEYYAEKRRKRLAERNEEGLGHGPKKKF
jgi:hypothetical protein